MGRDRKGPMCKIVYKLEKMAWNKGLKGEYPCDSQKNMVILLCIFCEMWYVSAADSVLSRDSYRESGSFAGTAGIPDGKGSGPREKGNPDDGFSCPVLSEDSTQS